MQSYIVIYETTTKDTEFSDYLKKLPQWGKITANSWVVVTSQSATEIRDALMALKSPGDRIFVVKSGYNAAWSNTRANNDWIKDHL